MIDMMALLCRLCQSSLSIDTTVSLFSHTAAQQRLRITDLPVARNDCLPGQTQAEASGKAAEEFENFRSEAKNTYSTLSMKRSAP